MNFSSITAHSNIKNRLIEGVRRGRVPHAQLFCGDSNSLVLPMAIAYARYLLCHNPANGDACEQCPSCYRTAKLEHPDLHFIYPVNRSKLARSTGKSDDKPISDHFLHIWREFILDNGGVFTENEWYARLDIENQQGKISKEEANELLRKMSFKSYEGGYKIAIIYLPERMNDAAANTLLKLIEEPPTKTIFLFVSEQPDTIIGTIRSRVQSIALPPLSGNGFIDSIRSEEFFELFSTLMRRAYTAKYLELFEWVEDIAPLGREGHKAFVDYSISMLRECYLKGIGTPSLGVVEGSSGKENLKKFVSNFSPFVNHLTIEPLIVEFELVGRQVRQNANPRIMFTHFALMVSKILVSAKRSIAAGE